jgi:hypothetical protein
MSFHLPYPLLSTEQAYFLPEFPIGIKSPLQRIQLDGLTLLMISYLSASSTMACVTNVFRSLFFSSRISPRWNGILKT